MTEELPPLSAASAGKDLVVDLAYPQALRSTLGYPGPRQGCRDVTTLLQTAKALRWLLGLGGLIAALSGCAGRDGGGDQPTPASPPTPLPSYDCLVDLDCQACMVAAHRGFHLNHPENSLAALRAAAELGASFAETDVRHTADGVLVVIHDDRVDRTTDGSGEVEAMSYAEIAQLRLTGASSDDDEEVQVPRFVDALALAQQLEMMLYVDVKTDRADLVADAIAQGPYYDVALVRDSLAAVTAVHQLDAQVLVMPAVETETELAEAQGQVDGLWIVELSSPAPDEVFGTAASQLGIKVQQDVMLGGDVSAHFGDYEGYQTFIEAGVALMQTDLPDLLVPAVRQLNETGVLPAEGPGRF